MCNINKVDQSNNERKPSEYYKNRSKPNKTQEKKQTKIKQNKPIFQISGIIWFQKYCDIHVRLIYLKLTVHKWAILGTKRKTIVQIFLILSIIMYQYSWPQCDTWWNTWGYKDHVEYCQIKLLCFFSWLIMWMSRVIDRYRSVLLLQLLCLLSGK